MYRPQISRFFRYAAIPALALSLSLSSLTTASPALAADFATDFARAIEKTHGIDAWRSQSALETDITVEFGGNQMIDGKLLMDPSGGHVRIELKSGTVMVFDGRNAWVAPADTSFQGARFHILTWSYFLAAPMKLRDPGTRLEDLGKSPLRDGKKLKAARLTFGADVGDTPDDWYVVYRDAKKRLAAMAYIVTFGKSVDDAEKEPHAITYGDYKTIDGVAVPHHWQFWNWTAENGIHGDAIGEVKLSGFRFVKPAADAFKQPKNARRADLP